MRQYMHQQRPTGPCVLHKSSSAGSRSGVSGRIVSSTLSHRVHQLEVVAIRISQRGDPALTHFIWRVDSLSAEGFESFKLLLDLWRFKIEHDAPRVFGLAAHLRMVKDTQERATELAIRIARHDATLATWEALVARAARASSSKAILALLERASGCLDASELARLHEAASRLEA